MSHTIHMYIVSFLSLTLNFCHWQPVDKETVTLEVRNMRQLVKCHNTVLFSIWPTVKTHYTHAAPPSWKTLKNMYLGHTLPARLPRSVQPFG